MGTYLKLAPTFVSAVIVTLQVGCVPEQAPFQPVKFRPAAGVAVSVSVWPSWNLAEQLLPQLMRVPNSPFGAPVTVPVHVSKIGGVAHDDRLPVQDRGSGRNRFWIR